jgi:hypothetical protein
MHKGMEGVDKIDAPCVAATCWRINTCEMGIKGGELTVEGACKRVKDERFLPSALSSTSRRWSKFAAAAAGEAAQVKVVEQAPPAGKKHPEGGRRLQSDIGWQPCVEGK